jgi:hypothetical protein
LYLDVSIKNQTQPFSFSSTKKKEVRMKTRMKAFFLGVILLVTACEIPISHALKTETIALPVIPPTETPLPTKTPLVGSLSSLTLLTESILKRNPDGIRPLVGNWGVAITGSLYEWDLPGYNNADEVVSFLSDVLEGANPECLTFVLDPTNQPPRAIAAFSGFDLASIFGESAANSLLLFDLRPDSGNKKYELNAMGGFPEPEFKNIPGERVSCTM